MKKYFAQLRPLERRLVVGVAVVFVIVLNAVFIWPHFKDWHTLPAVQSELTVHLVLSLLELQAASAPAMLSITNRTHIFLMVPLLSGPCPGKQASRIVKETAGGFQLFPKLFRRSASWLDSLPGPVDPFEPVDMRLPPVVPVHVAPGPRPGPVQDVRLRHG